MKNTLRMSLVAAVAVAGFSTTSSASKLEDAVKNTTLNGFIRYRYTNKNGSKSTVGEGNKYKTVFVVKSKVNDMVTAKIKVAGEAETNNKSGDADPDQTAIREANFIFNTPYATVIAGKQGLPTPFAAAAYQQGTGVVAVVPAGPVTVAAGWFTNSDAKTKVYGTNLGGNNITAIGVLGGASGVKGALWYAKISDDNTTDGKGNHTAIKAGATALNVNVNGDFGMVGFEANYAKVDYSGKTITDSEDLKKKDNQSQTRIVVSAKVSGAKFAFGYIMVGKEGGDVTLGDSDAKANFYIQDFDARDLKDTTAMYLMAAYTINDITPKFEYGSTSKVNGAYDEAKSTKTGTALDDEKKANGKASEMKLSVAYKMSKNFTISTFATQCSDALETKSKTRVEMKYTF